MSALLEAAPISALLKAERFDGGLYVCHRDTLSSLSPRKTEIFPLHLPPSSSHLPPPPAGFDPPLQPRWKDDRLREDRDREREREREREGREERKT